MHRDDRSKRKGGAERRRERRQKQFSRGGARWQMKEKMEKTGPRVEEERVKEADARRRGGRQKLSRVTVKPGRNTNSFIG